MFTPLEELKAFAAAAAASGKLVTSHIKAYSILSPCYPATYLRPHNLRALHEMLEVAHHAACRLQLSHFMVVGRRTWPTLERLLAMLDAAKARDLDCMIDAFPYPCGNSTVNAVLPYWFLRDLPRNYHRRSTRLLLRAELELGFRMVGFGYADFQLMNPGVPGWEELAGLDLETTARRWRISPFDALLRLSEESRGAATVLFHGYSGDGSSSGPLDTVLARPDCLIETDAVLRRGGYPNPAARGTFPRVLGHFARDRGLFSLEDAVHRMTGASAARFGLAGRGFLAPGAAADLVVFDPDTIADAPLPLPRPGAVARAGAVPDQGDADSSLRPRGIERVFLRGVEVVAGGRAVGPLEGGQVLRH
jgi:N-acyl-D-aspartate/D-glutamate deacylase